MQRILSCVMLLLIPKLEYGQNSIAPYCPHTAELSGHPTDSWWEGSIGSHQVRMYVERAGSHAVGLYYDLTDWRPILLGGEWIAGGTIRFSTSTPEPELAKNGDWQGQTNSTGLTGSWRSVKSLKPLPIHLRKTPEPSCDGRGAWRRFKDPEEMEFRTYCVAGGYVGQGYGHRFLLHLAAGWIQFYGSGPPSEIMSRILDSVK